MTYTRMLDWLGPTPALAAGMFETALDEQPSPPRVPPSQMSKDEKRMLLQAGINARGETPRVLA